jgi:hypothetical protein
MGCPFFPLRSAIIRVAAVYAAGVAAFAHWLPPQPSHHVQAKGQGFGGWSLDGRVVATRSWSGGCLVSGWGPELTVAAADGSGRYAADVNPRFSADCPNSAVTLACAARDSGFVQQLYAQMCGDAAAVRT